MLAFYVMREASYKVDVEKLEALSKVYRSSHIARRLGISRQVWHTYKSGTNDVPERMLQRICEEFKIEKGELALS